MSVATQRILIDTGPLVALFNCRDAHHQKCREQAQHLPGSVLTCLPVITEAAHLLSRHDTGIVHHLLAACRDGVYSLLPLDRSDIAAIDHLMDKYRNLRLDFADAALMHLAEREGIEQVFTLDHRDFSVYRTSAGESLKILPELR